MLTDNRNKRLFTTTLVYNGERSWKMYRCVDCSNYIIEYQGEMVREEPGGSPIGLPFITQCTNKKCKRRFQFIMVVRDDLQDQWLR